MSEGFDLEAFRERAAELQAQREAAEAAERQQRERERAQRQQQQSAMPGSAAGPNADGRYTPLPADASEEQKAVACLERINVLDYDDDYDGWVAIGMALNHVSDALLDAWDGWSQGSSKYPGFKVMELKWRSFGKGSGFTLGTLVHIARKTDPDFLMPGFNGGGVQHPPMPEWVRDGLEPEALDQFAVLKEQLEDEQTEEVLHALHQEWGLPIDKLQWDWINDAANERRELEARIGAECTDCIPPQTLHHLRNLTPGLEYDDHLAFMMYLAALGGAMPLKSDAYVRSGWEEPLTLYLAMAMPSGSMKSPLLKALVTKRWEAVERLLEGRFHEAHDAWEEELADYEQWRGPGQMEGERRKKPIEPLQPSTAIQGSEVNPEGLARHMMGMCKYEWAKRSVLWAMDEGVEVLSRMVSRSDSNRLKSTLLTMYDGSSARGARANSDNERSYPSSRLSIIMLIQDDVFEASMVDQDSAGITPRFLMVKQLERVRLVEMDHMQELRAQTLSMDANAFIEQRYELLGRLGIGEPDEWSHRMYFNQEANAELWRIQRYVDQQLDDTVGIRQAIWGKFMGQIVRVSALLEIAWALDDRAPTVPREVTAASVKRAERLILRSSATMMKTRIESVLDPKTVKAFRRIKEVMRQGKGWVTPGKLRAELPITYRIEKSVIQMGLSLLAAAGLVQSEINENRSNRTRTMRFKA